MSTPTGDKLRTYYASRYLAADGDALAQYTVDSATARENVTRFGESEGFEVTVEEKDDGTYLTLVKKEPAPAREEVNTDHGTVILIASDMLGRGKNRPLGSLLIHSFLNTLGAFNSKPAFILFMNDGVRLVTEDPVAVGELKQLETQGVEILACGTCLSRLNLMDKVAVGQVSNMYDIAETMLRAGRVVHL